MNKTRVWIAVALATAGTLSVTFALTTGKAADATTAARTDSRSEEHTSELQSQSNLVCRLLLEKKKKKKTQPRAITRVSDVHVTENSSRHDGVAPRPRRVSRRGDYTPHVSSHAPYIQLIMLARP